jgi:hypothetical protein
MELMDGSFESALTTRLRTELDALNVAVPAAAPAYSRRGAMRYVWAVGRPLAIALAVALLLGSVAAFASGSPNPSNWVKDAERSLGIPLSDDKSPNDSEESPSSQATESPEPADDRVEPTGAEREPAETPQPSEHHSPEPAEHDSAPPSGDG